MDLSFLKTHPASTGQNGIEPAAEFSDLYSCRSFKSRKYVLCLGLFYFVPQLLIILYSVLQINKDGMRCLSFFENKMVRWHCSSDMNSITLYKNQAGSFKDHNLMVEAEGDKVK